MKNINPRGRRDDDDFEEIRKPRNHYRDDEDLEEDSLYTALDKHPPVYAPGVYESKKRKQHKNDRDLEEDDSDSQVKEAKLPKNVEKGQLHTTLGISKGEEISDLPADKIVSKAEKAIKSGVPYATMIRRLNWQANMNKNNEAGKKLRSAVDKLHDAHNK